VGTQPLSLPKAAPQTQTAPPAPVARPSQASPPRPSSSSPSLTSPKLVQDLQHQIQHQSSAQLRSRASSLADTALGQKLQSLEQGLQSVKTVNQEISSVSQDLQGSSELLRGNLNQQSIQSTARLGSKLADLTGLPEIQQATGTVLAPMGLACSSQATAEACKKMWDEPSLENLQALGGKAHEMLKDLRATVELVPGGQLLMKAVDKALEAVIPGNNLSALGERFVSLIQSVKTAYEDPSVAKVADVVLETTRFGAAIGIATGIPIVSHISQATDFVAEMAQDIMKTDWKQVMQDTSQAVCRLADSARACLSSVSSWFSWA